MILRKEAEFENIADVASIYKQTKKVVVKPATDLGMGLGLFTTTGIVKGTVVMVYTGVAPPPPPCIILYNSFISNSLCTGHRLQMLACILRYF